MNCISGSGYSFLSQCPQDLVLSWVCSDWPWFPSDIFYDHHQGPLPDHTDYQMVRQMLMYEQVGQAFFLAINI